MAGQILCGDGSLFWSLVGALHLLDYRWCCPVDATTTTTTTTTTTLFAPWIKNKFTSHHGVDFLQHYLESFLTLGPPASSVCDNNLQACIQLCSKLGLPLHLDKLEGPSTCLSILGIEQDSVRLQMRLPINIRESASSLFWSPGLVSDSAGGGS